jgi:hypothetical protein
MVFSSDRVGRTAGFYAARLTGFILSVRFQEHLTATPAKYLKDGVREIRGHTNHYDRERGVMPP